MDPGILSTISALAGTAIGALASLGSTWMTTQSQARAARLAAERGKREELYGRYMDEMARLYAAALKNVGVDYEQLTTAFALNGRIALHGTQAVVDAADNGLKFIVDLAVGPVRSNEEVRALMERPDANVINAFAKSCRDELAALR